MSEAQTQAPRPEQPLSTLSVGQKGQVVHISLDLSAVERRRLLDLGFVPGTTIEVEMVSPGGDPTAYRVRGTLIALRREQSSLIYINHLEEMTP